MGARPALELLPIARPLWRLQVEAPPAVVTLSMLPMRRGAVTEGEGVAIARPPLGGETRRVRLNRRARSATATTRRSTIGAGTTAEPVAPHTALRAPVRPLKITCAVTGRVVDTWAPRFARGAPMALAALALTL